ncbi:putative F-box domain-containing protein [Medicago truncatula]|uniref:Putative F-box domain-containing protein n=1 Tax=Medicago truncatula TaxID=3880 RepID=A0A396J3D9_MEDTR|nr:putative F-box domain-containing protein [Medicago truncatula]
MVSRTTVTKSRRSNPTLPFDLVEDILYRLPVKSLAQFKSVSKSWKSLISDSNFTKKNLRVSTTSHRLLFPKLTKGQYIFNACTLSSLITTKGTATAMQHPLNIRKFDKIRGSCHGILCLELHQSNTFSDVWLMKEYGNQDSWTRLFRVPYMGGVGSDPYTKALYVYEDDQVLLEYMMKLVVYNSRDGTFKTLKIQRRRDWMIPEVCQESLISPCAE